MQDRSAGWRLLFLLAVFGLLVALATGCSLFLPGLAVLFSGAALIDRRIADRITGWALKAFTGSAVRDTLVIVGALMLIQFLPVELALLAAGDALAYVEVMAAGSLIAANTRLTPRLASAKARIQAVIAAVRPRPAAARGARTPRPALRRKAPPADADGPAPTAGWAFA